MSYGDYPDLSGVKNVLVIKLRQLGDVLLTGPVFSALKKAMPEARVDAYIYTDTAPMVEGHPALDGWIGYDRNWKKLGWIGRLKKEWEMIQRLRAGKYDLAINLTEGDRGAMAVKWSGARIRVGVRPKGKWQRKILTHVVKECPMVRHTVEKNLDVVRRIGIFPAEEERDLFLHVPLEAEQAMREKVGEGFVLIHPTSRWKFKCWPVEKMRELAETLIGKGKKLVFTSGPDKEERAMVEEIARDLPVLNLAGQISLKELAALIGLSEYLVCVDSVPFHMASALKKKVVAIWGPTSEVNWGPWRNPNARVVAQNYSCRPCYQDGCGGSKMSDCLFTLPVAKVLKAIESFEKGPTLTLLSSFRRD